MTLFLKLISCVLVCSLAAASTGCSSMTTIRPATQPAGPPFGKVKAGDTVNVRTQDALAWKLVTESMKRKAEA